VAWPAEQAGVAYGVHPFAPGCACPCTGLHPIIANPAGYSGEVDPPVLTPEPVVEVGA